MNEATGRDEHPELWHSPPPPPPPRSRGHLRVIEGSGLIDGGMLAEAQADASADPPASAPLVELVSSPTPSTSTFTFVPAPEPAAVSPVRIIGPAVVGLLVCVLGYLVFG
jgi:hypothetical protein